MAASRDQASDIELTTPPGPNAGTYRGREEVQRFWEELLARFEAVSAQPDDLFVRGDQGRRHRQESAATQAWTDAPDRTEPEVTAALTPAAHRLQSSIAKHKASRLRSRIRAQLEAPADEVWVSGS